MEITKGQIALVKFPTSSLSGGKVQPEDWFPGIVTDVAANTVGIKTFHPEQVRQLSNIPLVVTVPSVDEKGQPTTKLADNPDIKFLPISSITDDMVTGMGISISSSITDVINLQSDVFELRQLYSTLKERVDSLSKLLENELVPAQATSSVLDQGNASKQNAKPTAKSTSQGR